MSESVVSIAIDDINSSVRDDAETTYSGTARTGTNRTNVADFTMKRMEINKSMSKKVREFYDAQNEMIDKFEAAHNFLERRDRFFNAMEGSSVASAPQPDMKLLVEASEEKVKETSLIKFVINASFAFNVLIFIAKLAAAIYSGSLAVMAATLDSALDLLSGSVLYITAKLMQRKNSSFPVGRERLEALGILTFAVLMGMSSVIILINAVQDIVAGLEEGVDKTIDYFAIGVIAAVIFVKSALFLLCKKVSGVSDSAAALADDHRNDVLTNSATFVALFLAMEYEHLWILDPVAAVAISLFIIYNWTLTAGEYIQRLSGIAADSSIVNPLVYIALNHDDRILGVDTVRVFSSGTKHIVECDILLPPDMILRESHDIGESLQNSLEFNKDVIERAYVHLDYEFEHRAHNEHIHW